MYLIEKYLKTLKGFVRNKARAEGNMAESHSYDILGAGMLWKPKKAQKFVKIR